VANAYYLGNGTELDHHKAFLWYREAAFQGHILSQRNVGAAYWHGLECLEANGSMLMVATSGTAVVI